MFPPVSTTNLTDTERNGSFFKLFTNLFETELFSNINPSIEWCANIETSTINNQKYNLIFDQSAGVFLYDSNWKYESTFIMPNILYMEL